MLASIRFIRGMFLSGFHTFLVCCHYNGMARCDGHPLGYRKGDRKRDSKAFSLALSTHCLPRYSWSGVEATDPLASPGRYTCRYIHEE